MKLKRFASLLAAFFLLAALQAVPCAAAEVVLSPQNLTVDGAAISCEKYNIDGSNYFKLRDLAYVLNGTYSRFSVGWDAAAGVVSITTGEAYTVNGSELVIGEDKSATAVPSSQTIMVDGEVRSDLCAYNIGGNNFFKLRELGNALGFSVGYDAATNTAIVTTQAAVSDPISLRQGSFDLPSGAVSAYIVTVDLSDPRVHISACHVDSTMNHTALFSDIVSEAWPDVAVNANFFNAYDHIQDVIGILMCNGEFIQCDGGLPSLGFTEENHVFWGTPPIFAEVSAGGKRWAAYTVNTLGQTEDTAILYTPARGETVDITANGCIMKVSDGVIVAFESVQAGDVCDIPADGFLMFMGSRYTATDYYRAPEVGADVSLRPYLFGEDEEGFCLEGVTQIISGAPRLVKDGAICTDLIPGFDTSRFTFESAPRTAIGTMPDGRLIIVSSAGTIQQMRELMFTLGCDNATNLDGGASTALYYRGQFLCTPGRLLTSTLQISVW